MCDLRASVPPAVRGRGVVEVFPISLLGVVSSCPPSSSSSLLACFVILVLVVSSSSPLSSCVRSCPRVLVCGFLSSFSPFLRLVGRGVLCLLASFVAALVSFALFSLCLVSPAFACYGNYSRSFPSASLSSSHAATPSRPSSCSCLIVPSVRSFVSPFFDKRWRGAWRLVLYLLALWCRRAGGGRCRLDSGGGEASAGMVCCLAGLLVGGLCSVCGVVICIYELGACSCIMVGIERKRTRKDFRR